MLHVCLGSALLTEVDWELAEPSHDQAAAPAEVVRVGGEGEVGEAVEEGGEGVLGFETGERGADAVVDAVAEAEVGVVAAGEVEQVGLVEAGGVAVSGGEDDQDRVAGGDGLAAEGDRGGGVAPGGELHRAVVAEEFLDGGGEEVGLTQCDGGLELGALARVDK
jgi:hypothetical protein